MSGAGDELKKPLYWLVKNDSRNASEVGRALGWDYLRDEGKRNQNNPGGAITKAGLAALTWYLGGAAGGLLGSGGAAAGEGAGAFAGSAAEGAAGAGEVAGAGLDAAGDALPYAAQAGQQAIEQGGQGLMQATQTADPVMNIGTGGLLNNSAYQSMVPGVGSEQARLLAAQTGEFGPYGLGKTMQAASGAQGLSPWQQAVGNYGGRAMANLGGQAGDNARMQVASKLLSPPQQPQPQPMRPGPPSQQQQPQQGASMAYSPFPVSVQPSAGFLSEQEKQRLRAMGYNV